jgi:hypothetical protein
MKIFKTLQILSAFTLALLCFPLTFGQGANLPVPPNTKMSLELLSPISTASSKKDDKFSCKVLTPAEYADAIVEGHIRSLKRSGKANKESKIDLAFDRITLPNGQGEDLSATVVEVFEVANASEQGRADNEGAVRNKSSTVKTSVKRAAAGALIGALIGGAVAGGQGAAVGAAIGAGLGVTTTLATKGADLEFKTGTQFTVECTGPTRKKKSSPAPVSNVVSTPEAPSQIYRAYTGKGFSISVPDNWLESSNSGSIYFAPPGGRTTYQGQSNPTHGLMMATGPAQTQKLQDAADRLIAYMLQTNSSMRRRGEYVSGSIGGRNALSATLAGVSPASGRAELVTVHLSMLGNGSLFCLITVVPEQESGTYQEVFSRVLGSVQFQ